MDSTRRCSVDGCDRKHDAKGFCGAHYKRWRKNGRPGDPIADHMPLPRLGDMSRPASVLLFWSFVDTTGVCWEWGGPKNRKGYGQTSMRCPTGELVSTGAHRRAYRALVGEIPAGMTLDHLCRNTACVNPDHLEVVTRLENYWRATFKLEVCKNGHEYTARDTLPAESAPGKKTKRCRQCLLVRAHAKKGAACTYEKFCDSNTHERRKR